MTDTSDNAQRTSKEEVPFAVIRGIATNGTCSPWWDTSTLIRIAQELFGRRLADRAAPETSELQQLRRIDEAARELIEHLPDSDYYQEEKAALVEALDGTPAQETRVPLTVEIPAVACVQCGGHRFACAACGSYVKDFGPRVPDNSMVICPNCTSQFVAIPVDVQKRLASVEAALSEADRRYRSRHGSMMYADVLYALAGDLTSGTEHVQKAAAGPKLGDQHPPSCACWECCK